MTGALVTVAPSTSIGSGSSPSTTSAFHPGTGLVMTELKGVAMGRLTSTDVVPAVSDSFAPGTSAASNHPQRCCQG